MWNRARLSSSMTKGMTRHPGPFPKQRRKGVLHLLNTFIFWRVRTALSTAHRRFTRSARRWAGQLARRAQTSRRTWSFPCRNSWVLRGDGLCRTIRPSPTRWRSSANHYVGRSFSCATDRSSSATFNSAREAERTSLSRS